MQLMMRGGIFSNVLALLLSFPLGEHADVPRWKYSGYGGGT